ncbi:MAG: hypothetical protein OXM01_03175 [Gemmatimonadota bacterium]|nr:hypothetical protein [Gemmatimonadota bacterium]
MMDKNKRLRAVQTYMMLGEHQAASITRRIADDYGVIVSADRVEFDVKQIRAKLGEWQEGIASGAAGIRVMQFDEDWVLIRQLMVDACTSMMKSDPARHAHKVSWLIPQIKTCEDQLEKNQEVYGIYEAQRKLHERLKAKERQEATADAPAPRG